MVEMSSLNDATSILKKAGLRCTPGRIEMISVLLHSEHPLSQEEITAQLQMEGLDRVTVYRALEAFFQAGIVHRVETGDRLRRYALCACGSKKHCHPHFICRECGKVECLSGVKLPTINELKPGYKVEEQETYLKGICPECAG